MLRLKQHLRQIAYLDVRAEVPRTNHQANRTAREFQLQALDQRYRKIVRLADPKNDFVFRKVLQAMAAQALIHLRVGTLKRLQN